VGDFAILLRSGFSRWDAARAQLLTAGAGLLGALVAIGGSGVTSAMGKLKGACQVTQKLILSLHLQRHVLRGLCRSLPAAFCTLLWSQYYLIS